MKKMELTKKGKIVTIIFCFIILIGIILFVIYNSSNKISGINLDVNLLSEGDKIVYEENLLILHVDSKVQLNYTTVPDNKEIEVKFNNYDEDIISISSKGILTALKSGKTQIQIYDKNNISSNIFTIYVY